MRRGGTVSRRRFLATTVAAGTGLMLAFRLPPGPARAAAAPGPGAGSDPAFKPNAWIAIGTDGVVTLTVDRSEMGQGSTTALAMILADELEADWTRIRLGPAPSNPQGWCRPMTTGGSSSVRRSWDPLRKAGAQAREMLIAAAARSWGVEPYACRAARGAVTHLTSGRSLGFGELATLAATLPVPADPPLKEAKDFHLIGHRVDRLDTAEKVDGSGRFGLDVRVPGMKIATIERAPVFGAKVRAVRDTNTRRIPGVRQVVTLEPSLIQPAKDAWPTSTRAGVAVIADQYWQAVQGRRALEVEWNEGPHATLDSAGVRACFEKLAAQPGIVVRHEGEGENALAGAHRRIEAEYEVPFLHHAAMEPLNCVAAVGPGGCDIWAPTQNQSAAQEVAAAILGLPLEAVRVTTTLLGGGFGRRLEVDYVAEAVRLSKAAGLPVQVIWSREDDVRHGFYRPASLHRLVAAVDAQGRPTAWSHHIIGPSIDSRFGPLENGVDDSLVAGAANLPYGIPNIHVEQSIADLPVPVGYWRSVGSSHNAFVTECFLDEIATSAGHDPLEFRRALLRDHPRHRLVLESAAEKAGWGSPLPSGRGRGVAVAESFGSFVAQVAEVSIGPGGVPRVHRVVCAVDCGQTVNPDTVEAQMQGGIVFGLTAALKSEITIEAGGVRQSNFHDYPILRIDEMPVIEVHVAAGVGSPGGVGEPGVPPIAPAVVNAIQAATGRRVRKLPVGNLVGG